MGCRVDDGSDVYAQFAEVAPDVLGRVGNVEPGPQSHQLVGIYHGAPSAIHVGLATPVGSSAFEDIEKLALVPVYPPKLSELPVAVGMLAVPEAKPLGAAAPAVLEDWSPSEPT